MPRTLSAIGLVAVAGHFAWNLLSVRASGVFFRVRVNNESRDIRNEQSETCNDDFFN